MAPTPEDRDQFGGWAGLKFEATGFLRLEKTSERRWPVTPEGNAYLIHGMDHCGRRLLAKPSLKPRRIGSRAPFLTSELGEHRE